MLSAFRHAFTRRLVLCCATVTAAARVTTAAPPAPVAPKVTYGATTIAVSGITPRGSVVLFGAAHETRDSTPPIPRTVHRAELLVDTDGDGVVQLDLGKAPSPVAVWVAVDVTTGAWAGGPATNFPGAPSAPITPATFLRSNPGALNKLGMPFPELALLLVRPKVGAWQTYAAKHSAIDENRGTLKQLQIDLVAQLKPIGDAPAANLVPQSGDVIVAIDPRLLNYGILEVGR